VSDVLEIRVKKSHIAILSVVVLVASASAAVNVRDPMNVFGDLNMQGNKVVNATEYRFTSSFVREYDENNNGQIEIEELGDAGQDFTSTPQELSLQKLQILGEYFVSDKQISRGVKAAALSEDGKIIANGAYTGTKNGPTQAGNFTFSSDINLQGNNIYNAANINTGTGGGGGLTIPPYNDISSSRQLVSPTDSGPTYTNNHNGPRLVTVITQSGNPGGRADAFVNGNLVASFGSDESASEGFQTLSFFVPQGANYQVNNMQGFLTLEAWYEQDLQGGGGGGGGGLGDGNGISPQPQMKITPMIRPSRLAARQEKTSWLTTVQRLTPGRKTHLLLGTAAGLDP
jgi:hypothetical protein